jgi:nitroreductase
MDIATVDALLTTTRAVRKRLDFTRNVEPEIIERCLEIAVQVPTGGNVARYHFIVITEKETREQLAAIFRRAYFEQWVPGVKEASRNIRPQDMASFDYLAEHIHEAPVLIIPCVERPRIMGGLSETGSELASIYPATWSLILALRSRGIGTTLTTIHALYEQEAAEILGIPVTIRQAALLPVAYFKGAGFKPANRIPAKERTYWDSWGQTR